MTKIWQNGEVHYWNSFLLSNISLAVEMEKCAFGKSPKHPKALKSPSTSNYPLL